MGCWRGGWAVLSFVVLSCAPSAAKLALQNAQTEETNSNINPTTQYATFAKKEGGKQARAAIVSKMTPAARNAKSGERRVKVVLLYPGIFQHSELVRQCVPSPPQTLAPTRARTEAL